LSSTPFLIASIPVIGDGHRDAHKGVGRVGIVVVHVPVGEAFDARCIDEAGVVASEKVCP
jgi:hypothetical protein